MRAPFSMTCRRPGRPSRPLAFPSQTAFALALTLALTLGLGGDLAAQDTLDLHRALRHARREGPQRQLVDARATIASGQLRESTQWLNPSIEWRRENLGAPIAPDIFATAYIPFDLSGRRLALRGARAAGEQRVSSEALAESRAVELLVARSWLEAVSSNELARVMRAQATALAELARVDSLRVREGLVAEAVGLRTSVEADRARLAAVRADRDAAQSLGQLSRQLGTSVAGITLAALTAPALPAEPDSIAALAQAQQARPDLRAREAAVLEARRRLSAEQRGVLGEVQLQAGTKETGGFMTGQLGVAVPLPLFNRNDGARARATGGLREASVLQRDALVALQHDVETARRHYADVRTTMAAAATFDARATALVESARIAYGEGHMTLTELLDAERAAVDARTLHRQWLVEAWMARLTLELALSGRLDADSPLDLPLISHPSTDRR